MKLTIEIDIDDTAVQSYGCQFSSFHRNMDGEYEPDISIRESEEILLDDLKEDLFFFGGKLMNLTFNEGVGVTIRRQNV